MAIKFCTRKFLLIGLGVCAFACANRDDTTAMAEQSAYAASVISTSDLPQQSNQAVAYYQAWRQQFVMQGPCAADELYVSSLGDAAHPGDISVSEAMGYGLVITALMAQSDPNAQATFDKMLNFVLRRSVDSNLPLMTWRIDGMCQAPNDETSATDGELDIAYALLLASELWPNTSTFDYQGLATMRINAVMDHIVQDQNTSHPVLGLWEDVDPTGKFWHTFRFSDIMPRHFRAFAAATGDGRWLTLLEATQRYTEAAQALSPPNLVPDFAVVVENAQRVLPVPSLFLEKRSDNSFSFNACRVPFRFGHEVQSQTNSPFLPNLEAMVRGLTSLSDNDPTKLYGGYDLTGLAINSDSDLGAFNGPLAAGIAALDPKGASSSPFVQELYAFDPTEPYYGSALRMLALAVMGL